MSAPAHPTPGDITRRAAPATTPAASTPHAVPTDGGLTAPGVLRASEVFRQMFQQAMRISRMLPNTRLVALTLLGYANFRTGVLNKYQPDIAGLARATGLPKDVVEVQIRVLTQRQWLTRHVPTRGPRQGQEVLKLQIPAPILTQLRERRRLEV
ncbi:hypothetical protein ABTX35_19305 [Streptomyces sp. NPDC096080]|uniref:hypothetical protein n=1 Tax=Streptomyces sp. NPDC096080 TaxID=3156693 RepID=UPI00332588F1